MGEHHPQSGGPRWCRLLMMACAAALVLGVAAGAESSTDRFNVISRHPNPDTSRYFFTQGSESLPQWRFTLGMFPIYDNQPLNIDVQTNYVGRAGTTTVSQSGRGIEHLFYNYFYGALGLTDRIGFSMDFPLFLYYSYRSTTAAAPTTQNESFKPGDMRFAAKFNIVDLHSQPVGFALIPAVSAPTGKESQFLGDDGVTGELRAVVEGKPHDRVHLAFNVAYQTRSNKVELNNISFRDRMDFQLAAAWRVARNVALIGEAEALTPTTDFFGTKASSPAEARAGVRWEPGNKGWTVGAGGAVGLVSGAGMPRYSGFLNLAYSNKDKPRKPAAVEVPPAIEEEDCFSIAHEDAQADHYRSVCRVYFDFNNSRIRHRKAIDAVVAMVRESKDPVDVEVRGWTDPRGKASYNRALSLRRAKNVTRLIEEALGEQRTKARIRVLGIGEDRVAPHRIGRRVEVIVK